MKVLVVGRAGFIGTEVSRELNDHGHSVMVLSRTPETESLPDGVQTVSGDVTDDGSIENAMKSTEDVYDRPDR